MVMITLTLVMFTIQVSSMAILRLLTFKSIVLFRLHMFYPCLLVAAAAGELEENERHRDTVEEQGVTFFHMFGIWSPLILLFELYSLLLIAPQLEMVFLLD